MDLTEAQIQDLLYLRRLFCGKIGQLGRARKELMSRMPSEAIGLCHASDKLEEVTSIAEQLTANGSEEYRTYMQFASSFYRGVSKHFLATDCCYKAIGLLPATETPSIMPDAADCFLSSLCNLTVQSHSS